MDLTVLEALALASLGGIKVSRRRLARHLLSLLIALQESRVHVCVRD